MNTLFIIFIFLIPICLLLTRRRRRRRLPKELPPGSLGIPIIGQSLSLLQNMRANTAEKWLEERIKRYGPISKLSLFGKPTVFIYGQAANKFVFTSDSSTLANGQTQSVKMILGDRCLLELSGEDHRRVRDALMSFLKPESLKQYVGKMDEEVRLHIQSYWQGKQEVKVLPLMKTLTFNIICSLLFGIERGTRRDYFVDRFQEMISGMWSIPVNLPFTRYNRSLKASTSVRNMLKDLIREKRMELEQKCANTRQDLITWLISICNQNNNAAITEKEILDNVMLVMTAGHDTSSILLTFLVRLLANEPTIHAAVLQEQEEIAKSKSSGEFLTWEDLGRMKYTWRVALETMRLFPPIFGGFRKTVKDIEYDGYLIPKGWQIFWVSCMTQMDDDIFQEPRRFDPARFENPSSVPPYCYVPFGGGPRICPGYEFARIETLVTIHYLVTQFTWKLNADNFFRRDPMPVPTKGLPIKISPRKQML
ncbi:cytochrome P450 716B1 [Ricinus communis]|uniref:Cytochrome P450, putative n=1 Tax=Ricinus communis TaxID=3988 RepID=B9SAF0_RICCO|nr:cytochrome P450 716B1 [Ricinus communis]EEF39399.1 cytochrome P450, putative [Ricinus communis]|eukprot:XP_002522969.1 cytochrome P450 716B1 [Ricinus communis]